MIEAVLLSSVIFARTDPILVAVIPDTQVETYRQSAKRAQTISRMKADAVVHVGDVTDWGARDWRQFTQAQRWFNLLPDVPTAVAAGNHDTGAVGVGGSAYDPPRTGELLRDTKAFNRAALGTVGRMWRNTRENNWQRIGKRWSVLTLEMWPRKNVVRWANRVIDRHPRKRWIVNTHMCLDRSGRISSSRGYGATSPKFLRDQLVRPNKSVKLVLCGHIGTTHTLKDGRAWWMQTNRTTPGAVRIVTLSRSVVSTKIVRGYYG